MRNVDIEVDLRSPTPHYEQIRSQITRLVLTGALPEGTRLPPIRQLAGQLGLSNGAVARAYRELEHEGTVVTARKKGTTIAVRDRENPSEKHEQERARALSAAAVAYAAEAHRLGYGLPDANAALKAAMTSPL